MKNFARRHGTPFLRVVQQITMALTKGVVHFRHHRPQTAIATMGVPKTDGFEHIPEHTGIAVQPHLAVDIVDAAKRYLPEVKSAGADIVVALVVFALFTSKSRERS